MIYKATEKDIPIIFDMALLLWKECIFEELKEEIEEIVHGNESAIFIALYNNSAVGFAQVKMRHDYVEGTESSPVGYLEGIYVKDQCRKQGYARELLKRCEKWAREQGCSEFASDCELNNDVSLEFHLKTGFTEANRIICFALGL